MSAAIGRKTSSKHRGASFLPEGALAFGLVGAVGFLIDGGVLTVLNRFFGMNVYLARLLSFILATLTTWYLNRTYSFGAFRAKPYAAGSEYFRYLLVQIGGGAINMSIFGGLAYAVDWMKEIPVVPLAVGAVVSMVFTYAFSRFWVFAGRSQP